MKLERLQLLEAWRETEREALEAGRGGSSRQALGDVEGRFPRKVVRGGLGVDGEVDLLFPDDEKKGLGLKLLEKAMAWKRGAGEGEDGGGEESVLGKRGGGSNEEIDLDL